MFSQVLSREITSVRRSKPIEFVLVAKPPPLQVLNSTGPCSSSALSLSSIEAAMNSTATLKCAYWNVTQRAWRTDGCTNTGVTTRSDGDLLVHCS